MQADLARVLRKASQSPEVCHVLSPLSCLFASERRYANNQHELGSAIPQDPKQTSFFKAMELCEGVLIVPAAV